MDIKVGQILEFIVPVQSGGRSIAKGTRIRIGHILSEIGESKVTVVVLGSEKPEPLVLMRHEVTMNCRLVSEAAAS